MSLGVQYDRWQYICLALRGTRHCSMGCRVLVVFSVLMVSSLAVPCDSMIPPGRPSTSTACGLLVYVILAASTWYHHTMVAHPDCLLVGGKLRQCHASLPKGLPLCKLGGLLLWGLAVSLCRICAADDSAGMHPSNVFL